METALNKFSLNALASVITPGALVQLFILWGVAILFPHQPNYFKQYEALSVFLFITTAYITGSFLNSFGQWFEIAYYKRRKHNPRLKALEDKHHWVEDLDKFYFEHTGLHLYDYSSATNTPKPGVVNGKKLDVYNLSQFERYALFYLQKNQLAQPVELHKEKYLLARNLSVSFYAAALLAVAYLGLNFFIPVFSLHAADIFYHTAFVVCMVILLLALGRVLFALAKKQRVAYLETLYRITRYNYLMPSSH